MSTIKKKKLVLAVCAIFCLILMHCSPVASDGGTHTGNALVGKLYISGGNSPARGVKVKIRQKSSLADTSDIGAAKRLADTASVVTDDSGIFMFDTTLDTGIYVIEALSGNDAVFIDSVAVKNKKVTDTLPPDTLKPTGAIKGIIKLSEGGDPRKVFVLAFGIDRFARINADGSFKFSALAEGKYDLRLISSLDNYGVLDTPNVAVTSAETTDVKTIELPFTGIPTPKNVKISYDTLKQIVILNWDKADTSFVSGYNVYRRHYDSGMVKLNTAQLKDTTFSDSTALQNNSYAYQIKALDKGGNEGLLSSSADVAIVSAYQIIDTLSKGLLAENNGIVFVAQISNGVNLNVHSYNNQLQLQGTVQLNPVLDKPQGFDLDSSGNFYFMDIHGIYKFNPSGVLMDTIDLWSNNENKTLVIYDTIAFLASGVIRKYSLRGGLLAAIDESPDFRADGLIVHQKHVFCGGNRNKVRIYDLDLQFIEEWALNFTHNEIVWSLGEDEKGNIYVLGYNSNPDFCTMMIYDSARNYVGKMDISTNAKFFVVHNGTIFLNQGNDLLVLKLRQ